MSELVVLCAMEYAVRFHDGGSFKGLPIDEERLSRIASGKRVTLVANADIYDDQLGHLRGGLLTKQQFRLQGVLTKGTSKITIVNAVATHSKGPVLVIDDQSAILEHSMVTGRFTWNIIMEVWKIIFLYK